MISVLGYALDTAVKALQGEGFSVQCMEVRSKKGVEGQESRVVRQLLTGEADLEGKPIVALTYAVFQTDCI